MPCLWWYIYVHEFIFLSSVHVFSLLNWYNKFSSLSLSLSLSTIIIIIFFFLIWVSLSGLFFPFLAFKSEFCPKKKKKNLPLFMNMLYLLRFCCWIFIIKTSIWSFNCIIMSLMWKKIQNFRIWVQLYNF